MRAPVICVFVIALSLSIGASADATTKFAIKDSNGTDQFTVSDLGVMNQVLTSGKIGIGTTAPRGPFHFLGSGSTVASAGFTMQFTNTGTLSPIKAPNFTLMRNNDPAQWPGGLPRKNDILGMFQFGTQMVTYGQIMANLTARAEEDITSVMAPAYIAISTAHVDAGTSLLSEKFRITSIGNVGVGTTAPTQKLEVNGGARLNTTALKPTCDVNSRGTIWVNQSGSGTADTLEVCIKEASDTYAWYQTTLFKP